MLNLATAMKFLHMGGGGVIMWCTVAAYRLLREEQKRSKLELASSFPQNFRQSLSMYMRFSFFGALLIIGAFVLHVLISPVPVQIYNHCNEYFEILNLALETDGMNPSKLQDTVNRLMDRCQPLMNELEMRIIQ